jgi:hypothetical protein
MVRKVETFPPVTMRHIRSHGCRDLSSTAAPAAAITARTSCQQAARLRAKPPGAANSTTEKQRPSYRLC